MLLIDLSAIEQNIRTLKTATGKVKLMAVVKNNAYGHGLIPVSRAVVEAGVDWLGVVHVHEGVRLREAGLDAPILVLGYVPPEQAQAASEYQIDVPVMSAEHGQALERKGFQLRIHLKLETGLHRFGGITEDFHYFNQLLEGKSKLTVVGVYSHLAAVEDADYAYSKTQGKNFEKVLGKLKLGPKVVRHLSATAGALLMPELRFDMVRCGIGIYGLWPSAETKQKLGKSVNLLKPALSWTEPIRAIKPVKAGWPVGYGCTWHPLRDSKVALLSVGYADGLDRLLSNTGKVEIRGQSCPIVGRICTNVTFIDVTSVKNVMVGDEVTLIAANNESEVSAAAQAARINTINYELVTRLAEGLERRFLGESCGGFLAHRASIAHN